MSDNQSGAFLGEGTKRTKGRDAQRINILIAQAVAQAVKSTLGPKGMDKMIVDDLGDITISNDGATILSEMSIEHPAGKMLVEIAKSQDDEVGDGTTTVVILAGTMLKEAENLLNNDIHPSVIIKGYRIASGKAKEFLNEIARDVNIKDREILRNIALTSMTGKSAESAEELADLVVDSISMVGEERNGKMLVDIENIKVEKKQGGSMSDSKLIKGIVVDKEVVHSAMPKNIKNAKIALVDAAFEVKETETDAKIEITSPEQMNAFLIQEEEMLKNFVKKVKQSGANVLLCQKGIDDLAQHFLAKEKILAVRRVKKSDMTALARATGAKIVSRIEDLTQEDLGTALNVEEKKISGENMVFIEGCQNPKSVSILLRGGSEHIVDEVERAIHDALMSVTTAIKDGKIVAGGGSPEIEVAIRLREYSSTIGGREQLAIEAFANALEEIPRTLAETAGMNPLDTTVKLRAAHRKENGKDIGVDVLEGDIGDLYKKNVLEPLSVKTQAIASASEVAEMILRIDDIIAGSSKNKMPPMPPGGMEGMGD